AARLTVSPPLTPRWARRSQAPTRGLPISRSHGRRHPDTSRPASSEAAVLPVSCQGAAGSVMRLAAPIPPPAGPWAHGQLAGARPRPVPGRASDDLFHDRGLGVGIVLHVPPGPLGQVAFDLQ